MNSARGRNDVEMDGFGYVMINEADCRTSVDESVEGGILDTDEETIGDDGLVQRGRGARQHSVIGCCCTLPIPSVVSGNRRVPRDRRSTCLDLLPLEPLLSRLRLGVRFPLTLVWAVRFVVSHFTTTIALNLR